MTICSLVVYARPNDAAVVEAVISSLDGVDVHAASNEGKLVVSLDHPDRTYCAETIMDLSNIDGVLSTTLVYEYYE